MAEAHTEPMNSQDSRTQVVKPVLILGDGMRGDHPREVTEAGKPDRSISGVPDAVDLVEEDEYL